MIEAPDGISFARDEEPFALSRRSLSRGVAKGIARRIARGAYLSEAEWRRATPRDRYLARVAAVALTRRTAAVVSHWSAAAFHDLPCIGDWPDAVHLTVSESASSGSKNGIVKHRSRLFDDDVVEVSGIAITSLSRTVLDIGATSSFRDAVVVADAALLVDRFGKIAPMATREELEGAWARAQPMKAHARTKAVLAFAETRSESPIESVSRVTMRSIGVPRPTLQVAHYDSQGFIGDTDFAWPEYRAVGEADGDRKYLDAAFRSGRSAEQVVLDEKRREDRLRAVPLQFARWPWVVAVSPRLLREKLLAIGLPTGLHW
jgi:hypothetical protein